LREDKYTSRARLAIGGRSAGGITVGRAITERPEVFAAVIDGVGWSNPLRYVAEQNGYGARARMGRDFRTGVATARSRRSTAIRRCRTAWHTPAVLLTTGVTDPESVRFTWRR